MRFAVIAVCAFLFLLSLTNKGIIAQVVKLRKLGMQLNGDERFFIALLSDRGHGGGAFQESCAIKNFSSLFCLSISLPQLIILSWGMVAEVESREREIHRPTDPQTHRTKQYHYIYLYIYIGALLYALLSGYLYQLM